VSIQVEDYHKIYGETVAVAGISFAVAPGEILGLVGPNGAGKTTTLRALAGILNPTQGRLLLAGHDVVLDPLAAKRELAYVPDEPQLFERLTVWEHFRFVASAYRVTNWKPRAEQLLGHLELTEKRDALAMELSRGMRQKVAIGCGLLHTPRAILFDEPMTGLDPHGIRTMKDLIREYAANRHGIPLTLPFPPTNGGEGRVRGEDGAAVIISSHLLSLVEDLCTTVLIMHRGHVLRHGRLSDLRRELLDANGKHETLEELFFRLTGMGPDERVMAEKTKGQP
jgi:ABC-2 type transport system ATP-binding protein